ncbi:hypothetical protein BCR34DRAFT_523944 [Clohesyomyces aquaticus]|uniref:N-acetyltransferase domain-containing protein n=1 Tax=Clohesyomyces aquaticus TaxID=1231657 RepID=A0A1Y1YJ67_9PLEO|nr:hypothetical protein BCR34DRAFT_523944 [Clohesyomyces aquaticus]
MESTIYTPRLKLTLVTTVERGSQELEWMHELCSNKEATWRSVQGASKTLEDTENAMKKILPLPADPGKPKTYKINYAVHKLLDPPKSSDQNESGQYSEKCDIPTRFIGLITIKGPGGIPLPEHLTLSASADAHTLTVEIAYMYLPIGWGQGFATESIITAFEACKRAKEFWSPFEKVYVKALVNTKNPASVRVMEKSGMVNKGIYVWTGEKVWIAGEWVERDELYVFGMHLLE